MTKRIGILTSGGDCAGLNAVIRAVTFAAHNQYNWEVFGIKQGTMGLLAKPCQVEKLSPENWPDHLLRVGGTFLGTTNRGNPFEFPMEDGGFKDRSDEIVQAVKALRLDAMIGIGGDGSLKILSQLFQKAGVNLIGIPKTIDNDIGETENSVGYRTAVDIATEALDCLQPTAASHDRIMILEVMGRDAGHIALSSGIAGGADVILIPEIPYKLDFVVQKIQRTKKQGKNFILIVVAESVKSENGDPFMMSYFHGEKRYGGIAHYLADELMTRAGAETRFTVLGHVQRGGKPSSSDRVMASVFGAHAVDLINQNKRNRMVAWKNRTVTDVSIEDAVKSYKAVDKKGPLVVTARKLGVCFGDE